MYTIYMYIIYINMYVCILYMKIWWLLKNITSQHEHLQARPFGQEPPETVASPRTPWWFQVENPMAALRTLRRPSGKLT